MTNVIAMITGIIFSEKSRTQTLTNSTFPDLEVLYPLLPFGLSSPVQNGVPYSQNAGLTLSLYKSF